jgi:hypothetical protein
MKLGEFKKLIREEIRKVLKELTIDDVPEIRPFPSAPKRKVTDPMLYRTGKPKYPITLDVVTLKPIKFGVDYKQQSDLVWLDGLDSPENKYGRSGFTLKTNLKTTRSNRK